MWRGAAQGMPHPDRRSVSHWHHRAERGAAALVNVTRAGRQARACAPAGPPVHRGFPPQGCREKTDRFNPNPKDWSAFRSRDYGYTRMQVVNATHLYLEQVSDDQVTRTSSRAH